jgi:hypothetical protein
MNGNDFAHCLHLPLLRLPAADIGGEKTGAMALTMIR